MLPSHLLSLEIWKGSLRSGMAPRRNVVISIRHACTSNSLLFEGTSGLHFESQNMFLCTCWLDLDDLKGSMRVYSLFVRLCLNLFMPECAGIVCYSVCVCVSICVSMCLSVHPSFFHLSVFEYVSVCVQVLEEDLARRRREKEGSKRRGSEPESRFAPRRTRFFSSLNFS